MPDSRWWACNCCEEEETDPNDFDCEDCGCCGGASVGFKIEEALSSTPEYWQSIGSPCTCIEQKWDYNALEGQEFSLSRCHCRCVLNHLGDPDLVALFSVYKGCKDGYSHEVFQNPDIDPCDIVEGKATLFVTYKCSAVMRLSTGVIRRRAQVTISLIDFKCSGTPLTCDELRDAGFFNCSAVDEIGAPGISETPSAEDAVGAKIFDDCSGDPSSFNFSVDGVTVFGIKKVLISG